MLQKESGMLGEEWKSAEFRERYPPEGGILTNMLLIRPSFQMRSKKHCVHIMKIMNAVHSYSNPSPPSLLSPSLKMSLRVEMHCTVPTIAKFTWTSGIWIHREHIFNLCTLNWSTDFAENPEVLHLSSCSWFLHDKGCSRDADRFFSNVEHRP